MSLQENISQLVEAARHPRRTVTEAMAQTGQEAAGWLPVYAPEEIIHAAGLLPVSMWGGQTRVQQADAYMQSFGCSVVRAILENAINGVYDMLSAIVLTSSCDTLKAGGQDLIKILAGKKITILSVNYAQNRHEPAGLAYMLAEFKELKKGLEGLVGHAITEADLQNSIALYEDYRAALRQFSELARERAKTIDLKTRHLVIKAGMLMDKATYTAKLKAINAHLARMPREEVKGLKVVVTGIVTEPESLLQLFMDSGLLVVADDLAQESRQFRTLVPEGGPALERLARRVQAQEGCAMLYAGGKSKSKFLLELMKKNNAQALIACMMKFCDPEGFDFPIYKKEVEEAGYKVLNFEIEQKMDSVEQLRTRIQSFVEMF
jgi:benzoyl-CoA reductase/2-hydroxyglutaryl-CoA dehydratase subunit BcrC/BadD/HgdB